ncbi:MAG TPA: DUF4097 family beta strand repeat-containing protein [Pyrinomonadaceae bacterium]
MKHTMFLLIVGALAMALPRLPASLAASNKDKNYREKDEFRKTFELKPGARVEVSSIRGAVEIETADVSTAEVYIVRSAENRADLESYRIDVEGEPGSLIIRGETRERRSGSGMNPDVQHWVKLKLPRQVNVSVQSVSGAVKTGDVTGKVAMSSVSGAVTVGAASQVDISSVSGSVTLGSVNQGVNIKNVSGNVKLEQSSGSVTVSSVSGGVSAAISKLGERGMDIKTVSGRVDLRFKGQVNARLSTNSITGQLLLEIPNVTVQSRSNNSTVRALIGSGGPQISISSVSNDVRLATGS